jgi:hypothetical protein
MNQQTKSPAIACTHDAKFVDRNGTTCCSCGQHLQGYGFLRLNDQCIHEFKGDEHMILAECPWCRQKAPNPSYKTLEEAEAAAEGAFCD